MQIAQFGVFLYALLSIFVVQSVKRDQRLEQPSHHMVTTVGWGLFSLSSTLTLLLTGLAIALALGFNVPLTGFEAAF
jgi:hypothetical protein